MTTRLTVDRQGVATDYVLASDYERLLAALEFEHPKSRHLGFGIIETGEHGNVWGTIDYGVGCEVCDLIATAKGEA